MNCWSDRLDEIQDWSRVLSLNGQAETYFHSILIQELGNHSTIISTGHFHQTELVLDNGSITVISTLSTLTLKATFFQ